MTTFDISAHTLLPTRYVLSSMSTSTPITIIKSRFTGTGREGDFAWMIEQPEHAKTLFLFNDNEGEFLSHQRGGPHSCSSGGGNAGIRPYQCHEPQRALGIPTGTYAPGIHHRGYSCLDAHVLGVLDLAFSKLDELLATGRYDAVAFSWDDKTKLGGRIFETAQPVRDHIVERILATAARH